MAVSSPERYLADLNPVQREAVLATEGPVLVVAGAGSGKTRVLTHRVAHLIAACGVKPNEILAITFTNKAAGEMRTRLEGLLGGVSRAIWILTFHAACGRLERFPEARERWQKAFRYVLVDEYQDTNHAQYRLLQILAEKHRNVFAVGDPDQSIYSFRSADIRNILDFESDYQGAQTIPLEQF